MSNLSNEQLLERISEAIDLASALREEFLSTYVEDILTQALDNLAEAVNADNLEDAYTIYLPELNTIIFDCNNVLANMARDEFYSEYGEVA